MLIKKLKTISDDNIILDTFNELSEISKCEKLLKQLFSSILTLSTCSKYEIPQVKGLNPTKLPLLQMPLASPKPPVLLTFQL